MDDFNFSDLFCKFMRDMNITMSDVANKTDISYQTVNSWQKGRATPKFDQVVKLCTCYNVSPEYFCGLSTEKQFKSIQYIMEYTGLSEKAIETLELSKYLFASRVNGLDIVLSSNSSITLLELLSKFLTNLKVKDYVIEPEEDSGLSTYQEVIGIEEIKKVYLLQIMTLLSSIDEVTNKTTEKTTQQLLERLERLKNGNDTKKE